MIWRYFIATYITNNGLQYKLKPAGVITDDDCLECIILEILYNALCTKHGEGTMHCKTFIDIHWTISAAH